MTKSSIFTCLSFVPPLIKPLIHIWNLLYESFQGVYLAFTLDFSRKSLFKREKVQDHCVDVFLQCILSLRNR